MEFVEDKPMILSLQGCMAVGKTTAVRYIQENAPYIHISYEINTDVVDEVKRRNLDKNFCSIIIIWSHPSPNQTTTVA